MSTSEGERSPKRQRLESYSPASPIPPPEPTKPFIPNTPPPSVRMSPSWSQQNHSGHQSGSASTVPSPANTTGYQKMGRSNEASGGSDRPTPVSQYDGESRRDGDGDSTMKDQVENGSGDVSMTDAEHRRTDHERLGGSSDAAASQSDGAGSRLYKVSTAPIVPSQPHASQNLISLYGLEGIQSRVARRDPVTGEKINVMRKSYANKVKALGLEGRNKAAPNQGELQGLVDPGWNMDVGGGVTMWDQRWSEHRLGDPKAAAGMLSSLDSALDMQPGRLPAKEHEQWKGMFGLDDTPAATKSAVAPPSQAINPALAKTSAASAVRNSAPASPRNNVARPERANKKRRYNDSSFEGYDQGFDDDGYSTGGIDDTGRRRDSTKRQKRKDFPANPNTSTFTADSGTQGLVGVRTS